MTTYRWDRITADVVSQWAELTKLLAIADGTNEFYEAEDLAEDLIQTGFDPALDSWAVWDGDQLVAYGQLQVSVTPDHAGYARCWVGGGVAPDHRGRGIGRELMDRMEARGLELVRERLPGLPAYWRASGGIEGASVRRLLDHRGYAIVRYFHEMSRPIPGDPVTVPETDARLVSPTDELEEAVRTAHNLAFRDHWGSGPMAPEIWHDHWTARNNRPALSTIAVDPDGVVLAYVLVGQWVEREAFINLVGTIPDARGRGLAAACLARSIDETTRAGNHHVIELEVDSASLTGATRLYERVGFTVSRTQATMRRDMPLSG